MSFLMCTDVSDHLHALLPLTEKDIMVRIELKDG
jgi:hypothetical protein